MSTPDQLKSVQELSAQHLVDNFDRERGFALRAPGSHTDLWPGDPWTEAYTAIGATRMAELSFNAVLRSIRPDGSVPHLMQGSHMRGGSETNWIDRTVYRATGVGATRSDSGAWVTKLHAQPNWAVSAAALYDHKLQRSELEATSFARSIVPTLVDATQALYEARGTEKGYIVAKHRDEMTNNSGALAGLRKPVIDPSVNALLVRNNKAVTRLAQIAQYELPQELLTTMRRTSWYLAEHVSEHVGDETPYLPEFVLAAARLELSDSIPRAALQHIYAAPTPNDKHPEATHLSTAECVEIARLTPEHVTSRGYLDRYIGMVAAGQPITRFEGSLPTEDSFDNRLHRKQTWLLTDAQLVRIPTV